MTSTQREKVLSESVGIIGAGAAGLINAHVLLQDGFTNIRVVTRDKSVGGVWARDRVYPGLCINNVHGEYRFSAMEMPPPSEAAITGGRLSGQDLSNYMEIYYEKFLKERVEFKFNTEVLNISRGENGTWLVRTENIHTHASETLEFCRIILATGGCSEPFIPDYLSSAAAEKCNYKGAVIHSSQLAAQRDIIVKTAKTQSEDEGSVVVIGGGKSAQDVCVRLTLDGLRCCNVFDMTDSFLAASSPLPTFIRRSRFLSILSPHIHLRTRLERFLHGTKLGSKVTHFLWSKIQGSSFDAFPIPSDSPLRRTHSLFWGIRTNDVGAARPESYHTLAATNKIEVIAPARVLGFSPDGRSVTLDNGKSIIASAVILGTGYCSSWANIFSDETAEELGISKHAPRTDMTHMWDYPSLHGAPKAHPDNQKWVTSIHRGIIPAKNILRRDFAIAGALFTANIGYTSEVTAHWISSYFLNEDMRLPASVEGATEEAERASSWMKTRYPGMHSWVNASYSGSLDFWTWPQAADDLLEDMKLPVHRSGGSWLTWPFKIIDLNEIASLGEERRVKRLSTTSSQ